MLSRRSRNNLSLSIGTDGQPPFTYGKLVLPSVPVGRLFGEQVYECLVGGHETKIYITDDVQISPSVQTDNVHLLTVNWLYHRYTVGTN